MQYIKKRRQYMQNIKKKARYTRKQDIHYSISSKKARYAFMQYLNKKARYAIS